MFWPPHLQATAFGLNDIPQVAEFLNQPLDLQANVGQVVASLGGVLLVLRSQKFFSTVRSAGKKDIEEITSAGLSVRTYADLDLPEVDLDGIETPDAVWAAIEEGLVADRRTGPQDEEVNLEELGAVLTLGALRGKSRARLLAASTAALRNAVYESESATEALDKAAAAAATAWLISEGAREDSVDDLLMGPPRVDLSDRQQLPLYEAAFAYDRGEGQVAKEKARPGPRGTFKPRGKKTTPGQLSGKDALKATEDAIVSVAEAVCMAYMGAMARGAATRGCPEARVDACLSTRGAERFRNEAALRRWLRRVFVSVQEIYEDRYVLWALLPGGVTFTSGALGRSNVRVSRRAQLDELKGGRLLTSLLYEVSDVSYPLLRAFLERAGKVISFVLVTVIGQAIGLVFLGIKLAIGAT